LIGIERRDDGVRDGHRGASTVTPILQDLLLALGLLALLLVAFEIGFRAGAHAVGASDGPSNTQIGTIQAAVLGLLGLLLAFTFSAATSRFLERQDLIVQEANAIGTSYLRADLLSDPYRADLRTALQRYTEHRIEVSTRLRAGLQAADVQESERLQAAMWSAASAGVAARREVMMGVLPPVNEVIDLHATRIAANLKHLPGLVMGLLVGCAVLAIGVIGYGCGVAHRRRASLTLALTLLIGGTLWATIDMDQPRAGLLQLDDAPLKALKFDAPSK
jgi:hypothetical protein